MGESTGDRGGRLTQSFDPGDRLGRYELVKVIGGGGFAAVWRARSDGPGGFEREVAIKVMRPGRASQKRFQDMMLDEARLVARIQHPNVAQIWEVGEDPRSLYVVMELVDGDSLDELRYRAERAGKALSPRALFRVLADTCAGLHAAHELTQDGRPLGLVHRDISPQNILVARDGTAKLIDFGIAKAKERLAPDTTTGYIKGKIAFMAPEQARAEEVDRRADLWAIGAVAYEMLEGHPPCEGQTDLGRLAALAGPAPVPPMKADLPEGLRAVVMQTLQKDADQRFATALELKEAIEAALIEGELETSASDVASLFGPYFPERPGSKVQAASPTEHSVERAVSSTVAARVPSETIVLPKVRHRLWPIAGAAGVLAGLALWATRPTAEPPSSAQATSSPLAPTQAPSKPSSSAPVVEPTSASAAAAPATAPARASATPSAAAVASSAPVVQGTKAPRVPKQPSAKPASTPDENAIE